jgi:F-box domain
MLKVDVNFRWPKPSSMPIVERGRFEDALPQGYSHRLPLDILLYIVADCPVATVVNLSTTCRSIHNFITNTEVLNAVLRSAMLSPKGSLRSVLSRGTWKYLC